MFFRFLDPRLILLVLIFFLYAVSSWAFDSSEEDSSEKESSIEAPTNEVGEAEKRPTYNSGIFFGHILYVDPRGNYVFILPLDSKYPRQSFYIDKKTLFTRMEEGKGKRLNVEELREGDKVAVRYFSRNKLSLADEVFTVIGPFQGEVYQRRRGKRRKASSAGAASKGSVEK